MMIIKVSLAPDETDNENDAYGVEATVAIDDESNIDGYLNAITYALRLETFAEDVIVAGMKRYIQNHDEEEL